MRTHRPSLCTLSVVLGALAASPARGQTCGTPAWIDMGWGAPPGVAGTVTTLLPLANGQVFVGGIWGSDPRANVWNGSITTALPALPLTGPYAFGVLTGFVDPGGTVVLAGGQGDLLRWNGSAWSRTTPTGSPGFTALTTDSNDNVYGFLSTGTSSQVSRLDGTRWVGLGNALRPTRDFSTPYRFGGLIARGPNDVIIGGNFTQTDTGAPAAGIARWNGTAWSSFTDGFRPNFRGTCYQLIQDARGDLYATGAGLFKLDGERWSLVWPDDRVNPISYITAAPDGDLVWTTWQGRLVRFDTVSRTIRWSVPVPYELISSVQWVASQGTEPIAVITVAADGSVFIGGRFTTVNGVPANGAARYANGRWSTLGQGFGVSAEPGSVAALLPLGGRNVLAGGNFSQAPGTAATNLALWDGRAWKPFPTPPPSGGVAALALGRDGDLYASGFSTTSGLLQRWDGQTWSAIPNAPYASVLAVAANGDVLAGGSFSHPAGALGMVRWNGTAWGPFGSNASIEGGRVRDILVRPDGRIVVAALPSATTPGSVLAGGIAEWNGSTWERFGGGAGTANGLGFAVSALALAPNGDLYAGGTFTTMGRQPARNVARWDGTRWWPLGAGLADSVVRLALDSSGRLLALSSIPSAGSTLSRWDGTAWTVVRPFLRGTTSALAATPTGEVLIGGTGIVETSTNSSVVALYRDPCVGPCPGDYNRDGTATPDDLAAFIDDFYSAPRTPGAGVAGEPWPDRFRGFSVACPFAPFAPQPYNSDAFRTSGYRVGFSLDRDNACPATATQPFPNLDNLADFVTAFYAADGC